MYIVADIGGTKMRIAGSGDLEKFTEPIILDTPVHYDDGISEIVRTVRQIAKEAPVEAVVLGLSGVIVRKKRNVFDSNTPDWDNRPIAEDIESAFSTNVHMENDTALVGLGEAVYGAGKDAAIVVYMTVSTGVNAARIVDGYIDRAVFNSETGDQYLFVDGKPAQLGELISGAAISRKYGMAPKELGKVNPIWEELAQLTAYGLYNSIVHWSPDRVVLGGSMFNEIGISIESIREHLAAINKKYPELPEVVHSTLTDIGGLYGGMARLKQLR